jgi:hypothetical protein
MEFKIGDTIYDIPEKDDFHISISKLIKIEENRVLNLHECGLMAGEPILILFVHMYILRWAIPIVEIENNGDLTNKLIPDIQRRFWLCMYGRALDDLHDKDSNFFTLSDSIVLLAVYSSLLNIKSSGDESQYLIKQSIKSLTYPKDYTAPDLLTFERIQKDVCIRVAYFLSDKNVKDELSDLVNQYIGVLLGFTDLDDCIVDGIGNCNSTQISSYLYFKNADNDKKIHLTSNLLKWYKGIYLLLERSGESLLQLLKNKQMKYSHNVLKSELNKWNLELNKLK